MELILIVFCFILGWWAREIYAIYVLKKIAKNISNMVAENVQDSMINISVEKHEDLFLVYEKDSGTFLAQGKNIRELSDILLKKYPGKFFNASAEDMKLLGKE